jgi:Trypsin-co-occurring domain 1
MNGSEGRGEVVTATLPSGRALRVQVAGAGDGMGSVGLRDKVDINEAVDSAAELGHLLVDKLQVIKPTKAAVELTLGFTVEAGKLTALIVSGKADASLTLTMEWAERT